MSRIRVLLIVILVMAMPILPSQGVGMTQLSRQASATNGRLYQLEAERCFGIQGQSETHEWGEWIFIVDRN